MNTYKLQKYEYSSNTCRNLEVNAENVKFEENRVNFYIDDKLIKSYPSASIAIYEIIYDIK